MIGERLQYKADYTENLKRIGVTPLGEWAAEKPMTKDDLDAILIRIARRSPAVERAEPAKILDAMGYPPRDVSFDGIQKVLASEAFSRTTINHEIFLCPPILPLPPIYQTLATLIKEFAVAG